jgi:predicted RNA-binding protein
MCQAKIILKQGDNSEIIMEEVTQLTVDGDVVWLSRFFEPPTPVRASLIEADFLKHTVTLTSLEGTKGGKT